MTFEKGFIDYFAGMDWQEQQEFLYKLNKVAQVPFIEVV
jgi:hypothetical protein